MYPRERPARGGGRGRARRQSIEPLIEFLSTRQSASPPAGAAPRFDLAHLSPYAGALIVITAMGLFSTLAFSAMGGSALTVTALVYAAAFTAAGHCLWHSKNLRVPGGLLIAIAVSMAPLAVYGIQDALGLWGTFGRPARCTTSTSGSKAAGCSWRSPPSSSALIALLALSVPLHRDDHRVRALVHVDGPDAVDLRPRRIQLGRAAHRVAVVWARRAGCSLHRRPQAARRRLRLLAASVRTAGVLGRPEPVEQRQRTRQARLLPAQRRPAPALGRAGAARSMRCSARLASRATLATSRTPCSKNSMLFPFALSLIGVAVIAAGLLYHRHQAAITAWVEAKLPAWMRPPPNAR